MQPMGADAPKFASFRPKPTSHETQDEITSSRKNKGILNDGQKPSSKHQSSRKRGHDGSDHNKSQALQHRHRYLNESGQRDDSHHGDNQRETSRAKGLQADEAQSLYIIDRHGDKENLSYGSSHQYNIPLYSRFGLGSILGLPKEQRIDRDSSTGNFLLLVDIRREPHARRDKSKFAKIDNGKQQRVRINVVDSKIDHEANFLLLSRPSKRTRSVNGDASEISTDNDTDENHYRSIKGNAKTREPDPDLTSASSDSDSQEKRSRTSEEALRKVGMDLSRVVDSEPENGEAWLRLITYQESLLQNKQQTWRSKISHAERLSTADIKLSMYEKALSQVKDPSYIERLLLGLMEDGTKIWDAKKLASKWQMVLREHPKHLGLWTKYLEFQQTDFSIFRFENMKSTFLECLNILGQTESCNDHDHEDLLNVQGYIVLRLTLCMQEAGYFEHAAAIWQTLLEFNFRRPVSAKSHTTSQGFEEFWESEVPRIGEEGSHGWGSFFQDRGAPPVPKEDEEKHSLDLDPTILTEWASFEDNQSLVARLPARTVDEIGEDDPYRVILFSDIETFLLDFNRDPHGLLCAFLAFCHLPPLQTMPKACDHWWMDPFVRNEHLQHIHTTPKPLTQAEVVASDGRTALSATCAGSDNSWTPSHRISSHSLFGCRGLNSDFHAWNLSHSRVRGPFDVDWVRRTLRALVDQNVGGEDLSEYFLAFELEVFPESAKKTSKSLLRIRASSLRLYNAYALVEYQLGNPRTAESVLATAINMGKRLHSDVQRDMILLWRTWTWSILERGDANQALRRLLTLPHEMVSPQLDPVDLNPSTTGPTNVLRTQSILIESRDARLSLGDLSRAVLYMECLILLAYLTNDCSIEAALLCFATNRIALPPIMPARSAVLEQLHQALARLLNHHILAHKLYKPSTVRNTMTESIKLFPQNTMFLSIYADNEARFRIDDRVRTIVHDVLVSGNSNEENLISHFFAIQSEQSRSIFLGSNANSIRGQFEQAVESRCGRQSAAIWNLYFHFELRRGEFQRSKQVFYRAVRACPWAKQLYLLAFRHLGNVMGVGELRGVFETMVEKELRIHVPLDDVFDAWDERKKAMGT